VKESQIHGAFMAWLKKNRLFYVHSMFGKKATMTKDAPDFIILHCNRALLVECKTEHGALTAGQKSSFEKIRAESGMVVQIARSVEQAVSAVQTWLGVEKLDGGAVASEEAPSVPEHPKSDKVNRVSSKNLFIGEVYGKDYVLSGDSRAGGTAAFVRIATPSDLISLPRR
jgi:hypothetical protein